MARILIVEDEAAIRDLVRMHLSLVGHDCDRAADGPTAIEMAAAQAYDLAILDIMLPGMDGMAVRAALPEVPAIFLTARASLGDRVAGLEAGADDYIVKPFEMLELIARVNAVLRRTQRPVAFEHAGVCVDTGARIVSIGGRRVDLTPREYDLLEALVNNRNIALSREKLLELAWGYDFFGDTRTVDTHIQKLRNKLGWASVIKTVYKLGYRLEA